VKAVLCAIAAIGLVGGCIAAVNKKPASSARAKISKKKPAPPRITPAQREKAREEIASQLKNDDLTLENPDALSSFYSSLDTRPIHILQFGDSHTASDDWVNSMRAPLQARFGDGGPGFVQAGRPYRGYRRFDAHGNNSAGWITQGTMASRGDPDQGLSGVSISTRMPGQTVTLNAAGEFLTVFYLRQPGGGALELTEGDRSVGTVNTDGEPGPGFATYTLPPGIHDLTLRTLTRDPVRLFGWALDSSNGLTFETLGINGAQASVILGWSEQLWAASVNARNPALIILAYGTNEANSPRWTAEQYRTDLEAVIQRVRRAAPHASFLMIGPPDCGKLHPLRFLSEVVAIQREIASEQQIAFWDWRKHLGGSGAIRRWVMAGYAQGDYIHMTGEGYDMVGKMIVTALLDKSRGEMK